MPARRRSPSGCGSRARWRCCSLLTYYPAWLGLPAQISSLAPCQRTCEPAAKCEFISARALRSRFPTGMLLAPSSWGKALCQTIHFKVKRGPCNRIRRNGCRAYRVRSRRRGSHRPRRASVFAGKGRRHAELRAPRRDSGLVGRKALRQRSEKTTGTRPPVFQRSFRDRTAFRRIMGLV
jgi:hypothetical protein